MKARSQLLLVVMTIFGPALIPSATSQSASAATAEKAPAKWGPGCNKALPDGEFSLAKAPEIACAKEKKAFIDMVIDEVKGGDSSLMVVEDKPQAEYEIRGFAPLKATVVKETGK